MRIRGLAFQLALFLGTVFPIAAFAQKSSTDILTRVPENTNTAKVEAPESAAKKFTGKWDAGMGVEEREQGKDEALITRLAVRSEVEYKLAPWASLKAVPYAVFYSGRLQQRIETDDYLSKIGVEEAYAQLQPVSMLELRGGAIGERFLEMPLLVAQGRAFPGAMELVHLIDTQQFKVDIAAQQTVPTSRSLNTERTDQEAIPSFQTQSIHAKFRPSEDWTISAFGGHYTWKDLPSKIAFESQQIGNAPGPGGLPTNAEMNYGFDGIFAGFGACYCTTSGFGAEGGLYTLMNSVAPTNRRNAYSLKLTPTFEQKFWKAQVSYEYFFNESDATVAYYTPDRYGNTNRQGQAFEGKLNFKKYKFSVVGQYIDAGVINYNYDVQQRLTTVLLGLETDYANF